MDPDGPRHVIRPYRASDRAAVRTICADTGFLGRPIDPVFEDRELFADYLTAYYTDAEPEATFVCEQDGVVKGYVMGSRLPRHKARYERRALPGLVARGLWRYFTRPYTATTRRYVRWLTTRAHREQPFTPPDLPHFHLNILPEARTVATTRALVDLFFAFLVARGETQVYGQVVVFETRRGARMFERFGFRVIDEREVTKYRELDPRRIFLFTILKDLTASHHLYGQDLRRKPAGGDATP